MNKDAQDLNGSLVLKDCEGSIANEPLSGSQGMNFGPAKRQRKLLFQSSTLLPKAEVPREEEGTISLKERRSPTFNQQALGAERFEQALARLLKQAGQADRKEYAEILRQCGNAKGLASGRRVHAGIAGIGEDRDTFMGNMIVQMYGKCGSVEDARAVFNGISPRNVFSWTIMIAAYAQNGHCREALALFRKMDWEGEKPNNVTFVNVVAACTGLGDLQQGKEFHARIAACGFGSDVVLGTALINMYGKCGSTDDARIMFDSMHSRSVVSWNAMIAAYTQHGQGSKALELYHRMQRELVDPDVITIVSTIDACSSIKALAEGKAIHKRIYGTAFESDLVVGTALVNMYGKCGSLADARLVFDQMPRRNVVSWNAMITAYAQHGHSKDAVDLYRKMVLEHVKPTEITFNTLLGACSTLGSLEAGKAIHADIVASGLEQNVALGTALVNMYGKCGSLVDARAVFDRMRKRNVICWTAMIAAYAQQGHGSEAFELYQRMDPEGVKPDAVTFISVLDACSSTGALAAGKAVHARVLSSGFGSDVIVGNPLINMYSKCGSLDDARGVFDRMSIRNVSTWNAMIGACAEHGQSKEALGLYRKMDLKPDGITFVNVLSACSSLGALEDGKAVHEDIRSSEFEADVVLGNALMNMYSKCMSLNDAREVFDRMQHRDVVSWNAMISAYTQHGLGREALELYRNMDVKPTQATFASVLSACTILGELEEGKAIHALMAANGFDTDEVLGNKLINMYGKCGRMHEAVAVFEKMPHKDAVTWTTIIAAYSQLGHAKEALELFKQLELEGVKPDNITFISILFACSHAGLVEDGRSCFITMVSDYGIEPIADHFTCMVDLLGRAGWLDKAEELINNMPIQPSYVAWMTLLSACQTHRNSERGARIAEQAFDLDMQSSAPYVLLSNMYADAGEWGRVEKIRSLMESRGVKVEVGCNFNEISSREHGDHTELQSLIKRIEA